MAVLQDILYKVQMRSVVGSTSVEVIDLQLDSRKVKEGSVFIAIKGSLTDGHAYITVAIENKASVIVCEQLPAEIKEGITYVQVADSTIAAAFIAHNFFGQPSEKLKLVGVT